jgi:hypothetical protein
MDERLRNEIHELHCYWSDVVNYPENRRPNDIIVQLKEKLQKLEDKLYALKYKVIHRH